MTAPERFTPRAIEDAKELALPREFREGDWVLDGSGYVEVTSRRDAYVLGGANDVFVWLPTAEDCFDLLREWGWRWRGGHRVDDLIEFSVHRSGLGVRDLPAMGRGTTPLEAMYALLKAVKEANRG